MTPPPPPLPPLRGCITPGLTSGNLLIRKWINQTLFCLSHLAPSMNRPSTYTPSSYKQARQKKKITVRWLKRSFTFPNRIVRRVAKENLRTKLNLNLASWGRGFCQNEFRGLSPRSVFYQLCTSKQGPRKKIKTLVCTEQQQQQKTNITAANGFIPSANSKLKKYLA